MSTISYAVTVCNEFKEICRLVDFLHEHKRTEDEIVVLLDTPKASQELLDKLHYYSSVNWITLKESEFKGHFADWKNELNSLCTKEYVFQIDADEYPHSDFIRDLPLLLEANSNLEVCLVPRVNTVDGLTPNHIQKWGWNVNNQGWVNFPDYQWRIYKNTPSIRWKNKVHEVLEGYKEFTYLPQEEIWALFHPKTIERQEKQNNYYNTITN